MNDREKIIHPLQVWRCSYQNCGRDFISEEKCFEHYIAEHSRKSPVSLDNHHRPNAGEWERTKRATKFKNNSKKPKKKNKTKLPYEYRGLKCYKEFNKRSN